MNRARPVLVYVLVAVVGAAAFLYPFWFPAEASPGRAHATDAPLLAALVGALVVGAVTLEVRRGTMNGATVAILGVLSAAAGLLRLVDLPGNNAGIFFIVVLAGAAFGPRFGLLLGLTAMGVSAVVTGGIGPWLPFQMLALGAMGAGAGAFDRVVRPFGLRAEVVGLAIYGWGWGFLYGAIMNLWSWPFLQGEGATQWRPGLGFGDTLRHYWSYYVATSFAWDAAGALFNAMLILVTGAALLPSFRRFAHRLEPAVELV
jgi:energy-coupling factor transport system substrate-specific component